MDEDGRVKKLQVLPAGDPYESEPLLRKVKRDQREC